MAFKSLISASLLLAGALASPCKPKPTGPLPTGTKFSLMATHSGSAVHHSSFQAAKRGIFTQLPDDGATCEAGYDGPALFYLTDAGELYLYTNEPTQRIFTDRSGMGQGVLGYTPSDKPLGARWETTGWSLDASNNLTFNGVGFIACPNSIDGAWNIWVDAGVVNPGWSSDCVGISARAVEATEPAKCTYTVE